MKIRVLATLVVVGTCFPTPAYAYIDAGSASMVLQVIVAGLVGAVLSIKMYWQQICQFARKLFLSSKLKNDV